MELAGEIAVDYPEKNVTLIHRGPRLLEFIGQKASNKALNWLKSKRVEVLLEQSVDLDSITEGERVFTTSAGKSITADCHFVCVGRPLGSTWLQETILKESLDKSGRLMVDENLRVKGRRNIFAIGDITDIHVSSHSSLVFTISYGWEAFMLSWFVEVLTCNVHPNNCCWRHGFKFQWNVPQDRMGIVPCIGMGPSFHHPNILIGMS